MEHLNQWIERQHPKRVLIKISGEALAGPQGYGFDASFIRSFLTQIAELPSSWDVALLVGGGNFFRGAQETELSRGVADQVGILATVMNGLALQDEWNRRGGRATLFSNLMMDGFAQPFIQAQCESYFGPGCLPIFVGGSGHPYFTTDTAAVLWALRSKCSLLVKGTKVDGLYDRDPMCDSNARFYPFASYDQVVRENLRAMDLTAITLAKENNLPLVLLNIQKPNGLLEAFAGAAPLTWIHTSNTKD